MLSLLGMRHTEGSLNSFPPSMRECQAVFDTPHKPNTPSVLTVGAKALTKHCHRDETASWWGAVTVSHLCSVFQNYVVCRSLHGDTRRELKSLPLSSCCG